MGILAAAGSTWAVDPGVAESRSSPAAGVDRSSEEGIRLGCSSLPGRLGEGRALRRGRGRDRREVVRPVTCLSVLGVLVEVESGDGTYGLVVGHFGGL